MLTDHLQFDRQYSGHAAARDARCTYTRYADDLTFSTNEKSFPTKIAMNVRGANWEVGEKLKKTIEESGFFINQTKTRMSLRRSRQTVIGLVVNDKVNINQDYYRAARAMCHRLFQHGEYFRPEVEPTDKPKVKPTDKLTSLEGMLSHIYFVKARHNRKDQINKPAQESGEFNPPLAPKALYKKFYSTNTSPHQMPH